MSKKRKLHVIFSVEDDRGVRAKVKDAWAYWWTGSERFVLRIDEGGHVLQHTSGALDNPSSYQTVFSTDEGSSARVGFSFTPKPLDEEDVQDQLKTREVRLSLPASLARLGPIRVPTDGTKTVVKVLPPLAELRLPEAVEDPTGTELTLVGQFPMPWDGNRSAEIRAAQEKRWHPGTKSFEVVANTPNQGRETLTEVKPCGSFAEFVQNVRGGDANARAKGSLRRVNIISHANPGLISFSGKLEGRDIILRGRDSSGGGVPIAGALDMTVLQWMNEDANGRRLRDQIREKFTKRGEILLFVCGAGMGRGLALMQDIAKCFGVRVLGYEDEVGYYVEFPGARIERNLTSVGRIPDAEFEAAKASGKVAPGYPFAVKAPPEIPRANHLREFRAAPKPRRLAP